jgi:hypothetical protein
MKAYKVEILVIDHDDIGEDQIKDAIRNTRYPNHCISPSVKKITAMDIGEWTDEHPLNIRGKSDEEYTRLFG